MSFIIDLDEPLTPEQDRRLLAYLRSRFLDEDRWLTVEEVAVMLGCSTRTVEKMRDLGEFSFKKVGGRWRISRHAFDRDLDALG